MKTRILILLIKTLLFNLGCLNDKENLIVNYSYKRFGECSAKVPAEMLEEMSDLSIKHASFNLKYKETGNVIVVKLFICQQCEVVYSPTAFVVNNTVKVNLNAHFSALAVKENPYKGELCKMYFELYLKPPIYKTNKDKKHLIFMEPLKIKDR